MSAGHCPPEPFRLSTLAGRELWLSQRQIAALFGVRTTIVADLIRHLYKTDALDKTTTLRRRQLQQQEGGRRVTRRLNCYSRPVVVAVGWRVNSGPGEQFRRWASELIEQQCRQGYSLDQQRLADSPPLMAELSATVQQLGSVADSLQPDAQRPLLQLFHHSWQWLAMFEQSALDGGRVTLRNRTMLAARPLEYFEVLQAVQQLRSVLLAKDQQGAFGVERPGQLEPLLQSITAPGGYRSIEEQGAQLLWLVLHRQPFVEGNLQLAGFLFVWFLQRNGLLDRDDGSLRLGDNALVSMVLLAARSGEQERELLVSLLANLINREN